jgi:hypothetical protein
MPRVCRRGGFFAHIISFSCALSCCLLTSSLMIHNYRERAASSPTRTVIDGMISRVQAAPL